MIRDDGLEGKVAVISGGGSGIGRALAVAYARAGAHSVVGYLPSDPHDVTGTVRAVEEAGGWCVAVSVDTSDDSAYITGQQLIVDGGLTIRWPS